MVLNSTLVNPIKVASVLLNCNIVGSGTVKHFGFEGFKYPPVDVYLDCTHYE